MFAGSRPPRIVTVPVGADPTPVSAGRSASGADTVVLLTSAYPFGRTFETFLDPELPILARRFSRVIVLPSHRDTYVRDLPLGVRCDTCLADVTRSQALTELGRHPWRAGSEYGRAIVREAAPVAYLRHPRDYIATLATNLLKYRLLKSFVTRERLHDSVFYDYWFNNSTLALSWLRMEGTISRAVARAHAGDLYGARWDGGAVPFRGVKLSALDRIFPVSAHGLSYLADRDPRLLSKLTLSRLGVPMGRVSARRDDRCVPVVVSCASLHPHKRVELIPTVLGEVNQPLHWVHFGDGPSWRTVERAASRLPKHVTWHLAGHVDHIEILQYYRQTRVDMFISLSAQEGLPVSIMEAISHGIPILAVDVFGVPEIVTANTGRLVAVDDGAAQIAEVARELLAGAGPARGEILAFFEANYEAERNFGDFADMLKAI